MTHTSTFNSSNIANRSPLNAIPAASEHQQLVKQTQKWVAQTFYGTLLKQVRQSPFHSKLFEGGRGGEAFGALYDQQLAEHMARGTGQKLVNAIVNRIEAKRAYDKSSPPKNKAKDAHMLPSAPTQRNTHVPASLRA
jgi:Rod binding domain-containing protein